MEDSSFLDIGKEAATELDIDGWVQTEALDWSIESSFRELSVVNDAACKQYITGSSHKFRFWIYAYTHVF